jgi:hypothetical protein
MDPLVFSGLWVALAAGALCTAAGLAQGIPPRWPVVGIATGGTLVIYNIDHLRDTDRDHRVAPVRTAFIRRWRRRLTVLTAFGGLASVLCATQLSLLASASLAPVLALGLLHRRLKRNLPVKIAYTALAWVGVTVLFPALIGPQRSHWPLVALGVGLTLLANALVSSAKGRGSSENGAVTRGRSFPPAVLWSGRVLALASLLLLALAGGAATRPLSLVPAATLMALIRPRPEERFLLTVVDGALIAGSLPTLLIYALAH